MRGELPLEASKATLLADYEIKNLATPFKRRFEAPVSAIRLPIPKWVTTEIAGNEGWSAFVVVAWLHDGELSDYHVIDSNNIGRRAGLLKFEIPTEKASGIPVAWVVKGGVALDREEVMPWNLAAFSGEFDLSETALGSEDSDGRGVLHYASENGLVDYCRALLEQNSKLVEQTDRDGYTANWYAARSGRSAVVSLLHAAGAPSMEGKFKDSVLARAARSGHLEVVKALASQPAKKKADKTDYSWALTNAVNGNHLEIVSYLIEQKSKFEIYKSEYEKAVLRSFSMGFPDLAFLLMDELKVDASAQENGYGLLHSVASYADEKLLQKVAKTGADSTLMTDKGLLPADFAIGLGNVEAICWFYDNAPGVRSKPEGVDPLTHAIKEGQVDSVNCLLGYGIDVNKEIGPGISPIMFATYFGKYDIAKALMEHGGKWVLDGEYMAALISKLVADDQVELVGSVIDQGWKKDSLIGSSFSLLEAADFFDAERILKLLEERGWKQSESTIQSVSKVETKPQVLNGLNVSYPEALQERFGERRVKTKIAISRDGFPVLARAQLEEGDEALRTVVESAALKLRFAPAQNEGNAVPVSLTIAVPLNVDFNPDEVLDMADVDEKPKALAMATPLYPYSMMRARAEGQVVVDFILLEDGSVRRARALKATHEDFAESAIRCVLATRWAPAKRNGVPVACKVRIPIIFSP